jgi:hypothetical protein
MDGLEAQGIRHMTPRGGAECDLGDTDIRLAAEPLPVGEGNGVGDEGSEPPPAEVPGRSERLSGRGGLDSIDDMLFGREKLKILGHISKDFSFATSCVPAGGKQSRRPCDSKALQHLQALQSTRMRTCACFRTPSVHGSFVTVRRADANRVISMHVTQIVTLACMYLPPSSPTQHSTPSLCPPPYTHCTQIHSTAPFWIPMCGLVSRRT